MQTGSLSSGTAHCTGRAPTAFSGFLLPAGQPPAQRPGAPRKSVLLTASSSGAPRGSSVSACEEPGGHPSSRLSPRKTQENLPHHLVLPLIASSTSATGLRDYRPWPHCAHLWALPGTRHELRLRKTWVWPDSHLGALYAPDVLSHPGCLCLGFFSEAEIMEGSLKGQ